MMIRLNKFIAHSGVCSRRKAEALVKDGLISVNGESVLNPFIEIDPNKDKVTYKGKRLAVQKRHTYVLINKPKNTITTLQDEAGRKTVIDLIKDKVRERVHPVGRLDRDTTGLLLLTNDGDLTQRLTHPKFEVNKEYHVRLASPITEADILKLRKGLLLEDGFIKPDGVNYTKNKGPEHISVSLHSGRNRIVRRMFEHLGFEVKHLDRVRFAGLTKKNLPRGFFRHLTKQEVINLKHLKP